jgi:hypothetical protein
MVALSSAERALDRADGPMTKMTKSSYAGYLPDETATTVTSSLETRN